MSEAQNIIMPDEKVELAFWLQLMIGDSLLNSVQLPMVLSLRFISLFNCKLALPNALELSELSKLSLHKFSWSCQIRSLPIVLRSLI